MEEEPRVMFRGRNTKGSNIQWKRESKATIEGKHVCRDGKCKTCIKVNYNDLNDADRRKVDEVTKSTRFLFDPSVRSTRTTSPRVTGERVTSTRSSPRMVEERVPSTRSTRTTSPRMIEERVPSTRSSRTSPRISRVSNIEEERPPLVSSGRVMNPEELRASSTRSTRTSRVPSTRTTSPRMSNVPSTRTSRVVEEERVPSTRTSNVPSTRTSRISGERVPSTRTSPRMSNVPSTRTSRMSRVENPEEEENILSSRRSFVSPLTELRQSSARKSPRRSENIIMRESSPRTSFVSIPSAAGSEPTTVSYRTGERGRTIRVEPEELSGESSEESSEESSFEEEQPVIRSRRSSYRQEPIISNRQSRRSIRQESSPEESSDETEFNVRLLSGSRRIYDSEGRRVDTTVPPVSSSRR